MSPWAPAKESKHFIELTTWMREMKICGSCATYYAIAAIEKKLGNPPVTKAIKCHHKWDPNRCEAMVKKNWPSRPKG